MSSGVIRCHQVSSERQTPSIGDVTDQIVLHARSSEVIRGHQRSSEVIRGHIATWVEHRHELEHEGVAQRTRAWIELIEDEAQEALHAMRELIRDAIREAIREATR